MTTQREGTRLKEAYRLAQCEGLVAQYARKLGYGEIVQFRIDQETGFSDGLKGDDRLAVCGQFQLRYGPSTRPDGKSNLYSVWGRLSSSTSDADWIPVDGPWPVGAGPFDQRPMR